MATKRKWPEASPSPVSAAAGLENPSSSCQHLADYKSRHGSRGFRALQRCLRPLLPGRGRASLGRHPGEQIPRCAICCKSSGRLYACLICATVGCWSGGGSSSPSHARSHAQSSPGHDLALDLDRAELFCCACHDQVYDAEFDRVVLCSTAVTASGENKATLRSSGAFKPSKALNVFTRKKYRPWVPSPRDQLVLKNGATPLGDATGLPAGLRGLNNMGNTCFMNSVLQALLHTPPLRNYFLSDRHNRAACQRKSPHLCLGCDVDDIFSAAFSGDRTPYSPAQFLYSWWQHAANLAGYEQQDAHEFFISTVEGIHANSSEASAAQQMPGRQASKVNDADCRCIVHRVFSGLLRSDVTCAACGFTSTTYDPCVDISLDLEPEKSSSKQPGFVYTGSSTLLGCLDRFTRAEKLGSNERFLCESCQMRQVAIKQMSIRKLPLVLCFHVKRFEHSARSTRKVDRYVQFPLSLDMACFLSSSIVRLRHGNRLIFVDGISSNSGGDLGGASETTSGSEFELFAVVTHSGKLEGGHYVSYLRLGGQWYKCDDAWIIRVSESVVRAAQAYMLFYVQKTLSYRSSAHQLPGDDRRHHPRQTSQLDEHMSLSYSTLMAPA